MKKVSRISLLFVLCGMMFAGGIYTNSLYTRWFYPGSLGEVEPETDTAGGEEEQADKPDTEQEEENALEAANSEVRTTADTSFEIRSYDIRKATTQKEVTEIPGKYIGMTRAQLEESLQEYCLSPPLSELNKGFTDLRLLSFSASKVTIEKTYYLPDESENFVLVAENNYITVYRADTDEVYLYTDIRLDELPEPVQEEIILRKYIDSEAELYNFLESYSS